MENTNRLYRSRTNKMIGGVAGGLAEYFNVDVILMRLLFIVIFLAGGSGVLIYIILWIIMPLEPYSKMESKLNDRENAPEKKDNNRTFIVGVSLIVIGFLFLFNTLFPQFHIKELWPLVLIVIGAMLIVNEAPHTKNQKEEVDADPGKQPETNKNNLLSANEQKPENHEI